MLNLRTTAAIGGALIATLACGNNATQSSAPSSPSAQPSAAASAAPDTASKAADLRVKFDNLLGEHMIIAAKATGSALAGNSDEFKAYGQQLNQNGTDLGAMVGAAFGADAQNKFNTIWSAHNGFFVDYTTGVATKDQAKQQQAVSNLTGQYVPQFSDFIAGATGLPKDTVTQLVTMHVTMTKQVVDDQAAKNYTAEYSDLRKSYAHMFAIGDPVAEAIAKKMSDKFPGDAASKAVDLRVALNRLLQEHLYLATLATDAALGGRSDEFKAAGDALNTNGTDIGAAVGSLFGADAQSKFNTIWSAHDGFFVDYTTGVATKDQAKQQQAVNNLTGQYIPQFSDFISGATGLPKDTVASLTKDHVLTTKQVVDDQGGKSWDKAATDDVAAARHMEMIADPLAQGIVQKLPQKFQ